jgi:hypothetical protein
MAGPVRLLSRARSDACRTRTARLLLGEIEQDAKALPYEL